MILLIDNYDSFTYNIVQALGIMHEKITVVRNDGITVKEAKQLAPDYLVISPGPGRPEDAGISNELIKEFCQKIPILGICLGHQCLAHVFGGRIVHAERLIHGKTSRVYHDANDIFRGIPNPITAGRYHSLVVEEETLPSCLEISAHTTEGEIMGVSHKKFPVHGVQFHPESVMTKTGHLIFQNFLNLLRRER